MIRFSSGASLVVLNCLLAQANLNPIANAEVDWVKLPIEIVALPKESGLICNPNLLEFLSTTDWYFPF